MLHNRMSGELCYRVCTCVSRTVWKGLERGELNKVETDALTPRL
jgi:hypothetical protein